MEDMADIANTAAAVPIAVGAAGAFAVANVAQMRAARQAKGSSGLSVRLLLQLVRDPVWLFGFGGSVVGFGLQATALYLAPVVLVQPLIVTELLFALPAAAMLGGVRLGYREWGGAALVAAGISCFVLVGRPSGESTHVAAGLWPLTLIAAAGGVAVLIVLAEARQDRPSVRATLLAAAASICFGILSVLTKVVGHQFDKDGVAALRLPQPWLLAVAALTGLLLAQTAFRIAPLSISLPVIDIGEPLIASIVAALLLGERIDVSAATLAGVVLAGLAMAAGVALLDTSPLVRQAQRDIAARSPDASRQEDHDGAVA
jgi:drug/metabolite transporter (DMT)-like permease